MWNVTDWNKVVFSDESRFVLVTDDNCERVWRYPAVRYNSPYTVLRHTARTAGVMNSLLQIFMKGTQIATINTRFVYAMRSIGKRCRSRENVLRRNESSATTYKVFSLRDLSHPDLLKKCLHGKTQNPNESFHNVVWSRVPKATFVQIETLSLGVYDAVCSFNDGNVSKLKMLQKMGVEPGEFSVSAMKLLDRERLMKAIYAFSGRSKKIRKDKKKKKKERR
ncbi:uncharacterized protein TNCV_3692041 [Trichonephila clavipes]|nr:uncharacterized protein TNCV_3692041 [Trichonephila clavipes]